MSRKSASIAAAIAISAAAFSGSAFAQAAGGGNGGGGAGGSGTPGGGGSSIVDISPTVPNIAYFRRDPNGTLPPVYRGRPPSSTLCADNVATASRMDCGFR
jgi:hypothetical protein